MLPNGTCKFIIKPVFMSKCSTNTFICTNIKLCNIQQQWKKSKIVPKHHLSETIGFKLSHILIIKYLSIRHIYIYQMSFHVTFLLLRHHMSFLTIRLYLSHIYPYHRSHVYLHNMSLYIYKGRGLGRDVICIDMWWYIVYLCHISLYITCVSLS